MDDADRRIAELEAEIEAEEAARKRAVEEAEAEQAAIDRARDAEGDEEDEDDAASDPPPRKKKRRKKARRVVEVDDDDDPEDDGGSLLDDAMSAAAEQAVTALVTRKSRGEGGDDIGKKALRVAKQKMPKLPSSASMQTTALKLVGVGVGGMVLWHYLGWLLAIPLMILKAGFYGAGLYGIYWVASKFMADDEDEDEPED